MKGLYLFAILFLVLFSSTLISATSVDWEKICPECISHCSDFDWSGTFIWGEISDATTGDKVEGASVTINCSGSIKTDTTGPYGFYAVWYTDQNECKFDDTVIVSAQKDNLAGSKTETVNDWDGIWVDIERVDVPLVPEFGTIVGLMTILSAVGIFFVVRKD